MYQALYRKYRPRSFDDVVGQDIIKTTIINSIKYDNLSHAYLFYGPRGTGKTSTAKLISKLINCFNLNDVKPCEKCEYCLSLEKQNLDIIEIDAASNNGVDEIRELRNKVNIMPSLGKYKIYIIDEVHMLSIGAFNALLKTLEEPPKHVIFILATTEINKIPETIISRCQRFDFKRISENAIVERLKYICDCENIEIELEVIKKIAQISNGGLRDAIGMLDKALSYCPNKKITIKELNDIAYITSKEDIEKIINHIQTFDIKKYIELINKLNDEGKNLINLVDELIIYSRDSLINDSGKMQGEFLINIIKELNDLSIKMKNSPYPKILLEMLIIKINYIDLSNLEKNAVPKKENNNISLKITCFEELKNIRINNTLCGADKIQLSNVKNKWKDINLILLDEKYNKFLSFIPDLNIIAAADDYLLLSSKYDSIIEKSLENFLLIQEAIKEAYGKEYKIMFVTNLEWNKIKKQYISNTKNNVKYKYIKENVDIEKILEGELVK